MNTITHGTRRLERAARGFAGIVAAILALGGCQSPGALSTAASMLVEVDVYKGPLGSSKTVQLGELAAIFDQAEHLLGLFVSDAEAVGGCTSNTAGNPRPSVVERGDRQYLCDASARAKVILTNLKRFPDLPTDDKRHLGLKELNGQAAEIIKYHAQRNASSSPGSAASAPPVEATKAAARINLTVMEASRLATQLKVEAFFWSEVQIGRVTEDPTVRSMLVRYVNLTSELANQISARTVAIDKQLDLNVGGNTLALSDHLKEAGPSDFLHLYDWYDATLSDPLNRWPGRLSTPDRVRLAKRLFSDHYWTRINQVHASGQGETRVALIKDDIGNWNLKSFDNDSEQLLNAYRNLTYAGIEAGIRVAKEVSSGGGAAGLELASQFARGRLGSTQTSTLSAQRIDAMRAGVAERLEKIRADAAKEDDTQKGLEDAAANALKQRKEETNAAQAAVNTAPDADLPAAQKRLADARAQETVASGLLDTAQAQRREKMAVAFENARREIEVHRRVIDSLKEFQITSPSTPTTPRTLSNTLKP